MSDTNNRTAPAPWHLWVVGGLMVLWNGFGVFDFGATVLRFEPYVSQFSQEMMDYIYTWPAWLFVVWGVAVIGGFTGSVLLLFRHRLAVAAFAVSLASAIVSMAAGYLMPTPEEMQNPAMTAIIILVALGLLGYAMWMQRRGVLK